MTIIDQYRAIEENKLEVVLEKRGIDVVIQSATPKVTHENSVNLFKQDYGVAEADYDIPKLESDIQTEYEFNQINGKILLVQQDNTQLHQWEWSPDEDFNVQPIIFCYINQDILVGSKVTFRNILYTVKKKHTHRGLINFPIYELAKD